MASRKISMYAEKQYNLTDIKEKMQKGFDAEFVGEAAHELGETKTLLLIWEKWYLRTGSYASLTILLSEFQGYQSADIIASGGKDDFFSWGAEENFAKAGEDLLKNLGFLTKVE